MFSYILEKLGCSFRFITKCRVPGHTGLANEFGFELSQVGLGGGLIKGLQRRLTSLSDGITRLSGFLCLLALSMFYIILQTNLFGYSASFEELFALSFTLLPIFILWFIFRIVFNPIQAALLIAWFVAILSWISLIKSSATNLPLGWNDIFSLKNWDFSRNTFLLVRCFFWW